MSLLPPIIRIDPSRCLDSLLASDCPGERLEVICVDNASNDRTAEIVRGHGQRVRIVSETRPGPAAARNAELRAAPARLRRSQIPTAIVDAAWLARVVAPIAAGAADALGGRILARKQAGVVERFGELVHDHRWRSSTTGPPT